MSSARLSPVADLAGSTTSPTDPRQTPSPPNTGGTGEPTPMVDQHPLLHYPPARQYDLDMVALSLSMSKGDLQKTIASAVMDGLSPDNELEPYVCPTCPQLEEQLAEKERVIEAARAHAEGLQGRLAELTHELNELHARRAREEAAYQAEIARERARGDAILADLQRLQMNIRDGGLETAMQLFDAMDTTRCGKVTLPDIQRVLQTREDVCVKLGMAKTLKGQWKWPQLFRFMDRNGDGYVDRQEFVEAWAASKGGGGERIETWEEKQIKMLKAEVLSLKAACQAKEGTIREMNAEIKGRPLTKGMPTPPLAASPSPADTKAAAVALGAAIRETTKAVMSRIPKFANMPPPPSPSHSSKSTPRVPQNTVADLAKDRELDDLQERIRRQDAELAELRTVNGSLKGKLEQMRKVHRKEVDEVQAAATRVQSKEVEVLQRKAAEVKALQKEVEVLQRKAAEGKALQKEVDELRRELAAVRQQSHQRDRRLEKEWEKEREKAQKIAQESKEVDRLQEKVEQMRLLQGEALSTIRRLQSDIEEKSRSEARVNTELARVKKELEDMQQAAKDKPRDDPEHKLCEEVTRLRKDCKLRDELIAVLEGRLAEAREAIVAASQDSFAKEVKLAEAKKLVTALISNSSNREKNKSTMDRVRDICATAMAEAESSAPTALHNGTQRAPCKSPTKVETRRGECLRAFPAPVHASASPAMHSPHRRR